MAIDMCRRIHLLCRRFAPGSMDHKPDHEGDREMEEKEMIALRRGQCFYNEKNGEYVYIAETTLVCTYVAHKLLGGRYQ